MLYDPFPHFTVSNSTITHVDSPESYSVRMVGREGSDSIGQRAKWQNTIYKDPTMTARPTMIAVIAEREGEIVGVCGASTDSPFMWRLGIDVAPEHQGRGIAPLPSHQQFQKPCSMKVSSFTTELQHRTSHP